MFIWESEDPLLFFKNKFLINREKHVKYGWRLYLEKKNYNNYNSSERYRFTIIQWWHINVKPSNLRVGWVTKNISADALNKAPAIDSARQQRGISTLTYQRPLDLHLQQKAHHAESSKIHMACNKRGSHLSHGWPQWLMFPLTKYGWNIFKLKLIQYDYHQWPCF